MFKLMRVNNKFVFLDKHGTNLKESINLNYLGLTLSLLSFPAMLTFWFYIKNVIFSNIDKAPVIAVIFFSLVMLVPLVFMFCVTADCIESLKEVKKKYNLAVVDRQEEMKEILREEEMFRIQLEDMRTKKSMQFEFERNS